MVCVVELDAIAIDKADCRVRTEGRDGELLQEISPDLKVRSFLAFGFPCLGFPYSLLCNTVADATRSRPAIYLPCLPIGIERLARGSLS